MPENGALISLVAGHRGFRTGRTTLTTDLFAIDAAWARTGADRRYNRSRSSKVDRIDVYAHRLYSMRDLNPQSWEKHRHQTKPVSSRSTKFPRPTRVMPMATSAIQDDESVPTS